MSSDDTDLLEELLKENLQVQEMVRWFLSVYERPEENTPRDEGEWVWIHGGPYNVTDEIEERFPKAKPEDLKRAVKLLEEDCLEWTKQPRRGEGDE